MKVNRNVHYSISTYLRKTNRLTYFLMENNISGILISKGIKKYISFRHDYYTYSLSMACIKNNLYIFFNAFFQKLFFKLM